MDILTLIYGGRVFLNRRPCVIAMLSLSIIMIIGTIFVSIILPDHEKWMIVVALSGSILLLLISLLILKFACKAPDNIKSNNYFSETLLLISALAFCLLNMLIAYGSYTYGYSKSGAVVLFFSVAVLLFRQWKYRFLFLFLLLLLGGGLIELGVG